jgi:hypothetical protein
VTPFILIEIYHVFEETAALACRVRGIRKKHG